MAGEHEARDHLARSFNHLFVFLCFGLPFLTLYQIRATVTVVVAIAAVGFIVIAGVASAAVVEQPFEHAGPG